jgi:hypothetical protein
MLRVALFWPRCAHGSLRNMHNGAGPRVSRRRTDPLLLRPLVALGRSTCSRVTEMSIQAPYYRSGRAPIAGRTRCGAASVGAIDVLRALATSPFTRRASPRPRPHRCSARSETPHHRSSAPVAAFALSSPCHIGGLAARVRRGGTLMDALGSFGTLPTLAPYSSPAARRTPTRITSARHLSQR